MGVGVAWHGVAQARKNMHEICNVLWRQGGNGRVDAPPTGKELIKKSHSPPRCRMQETKTGEGGGMEWQRR